MKSVALLGCGTIGGIIARRADTFTVSAVYDQEADRRSRLAGLTGAADCADFATLLCQDFDLLVEAASPEAVRRFAPEALAASKNLVILSVGALADTDLRESLEALAASHGVRIHVPSGAVIGLDNLKIGQISPFERLTLKTTKPPAVLGVEATEATCIFRGPASECVALFPRNINVAMSVSLAAGRECDVEIWADPAVSANTHHIIAEGEFGRAEMRVENVPSPDNPRTSYLAALSVLALIETFDRPLRVGT